MGDPQPDSSYSKRLERLVTLGLERTLRPLMRLLLRLRVPFGTFAAVAKRAYIHEAASRQFGIKGRHPTKARIAMLTGMTRTEVASIMSNQQYGDLDSLAPRYFSKTATVLESWYSDPELCDPGGEPLPLPERGKGATFESLVQNKGGDIPLKTISDELVHLGVAEHDSEGRLKLKDRSYVSLSADAINCIQAGFGAMSNLLNTINDNVSQIAEADSSEEVQRLFQREAWSRAIPPHQADELREELHELLRRHFDELSHRLEETEELPPMDGYHVTTGVGMYYFENGGR